MTEYKSKDIFGDVCGFLHRHPRLEGLKCLDAGHVIVDVADWEAARELLSALKNIVNAFEPDIPGSSSNKKGGGGPRCQKRRLSRWNISGNQKT